MALAALASTNEAPANESSHQLDDFQQAMIVQAFQADSRILPGHTVAAEFGSITTESEAAEYLLRVRESIAAHRNGAPKKTAGKTTKKKPSSKKS